MALFPHAKTTPIAAIAGLVASKVQGALEALKDMIDAITPDGDDGSVQFNDNGAFSGSAGLLWNDTEHTLTIQGSAATDGPTWGDELLTSGGWTVGAGWTESPDDVFAHSSGTAALSHSASTEAGNINLLRWTVAGRTAGTLTISLGGRSVAGVTASGSFGPLAIATDGPVITPSADFNGTISAVSLKALISGSLPTLIAKDSGGASNLEARLGSSDSVFVGKMSGSMATGSYNSVGGGARGLEYLSSGTGNTATGCYALRYNTTGSNNTGIGIVAGAALTNGSSPNLFPERSTYLGAYTKALNEGGDNETVIGYDAIGHGSNTATLGNDSVTDTYLKGDLHTTGNVLALNSDAAGSGADWAYTLQRPTSGMTAAVALTLPPNDGTSGQVLETDGTGVLSWVDAASGQGVPKGGTAGQVLAKIDGTDYNTEWVDPSTPGAHTHTEADIDSETATDGYVLTADGAGNSAWEALPAGGGSGDVVGPASSTDNAISRYDGTTGKLVQDSGWLLEDDGTLAKYNVTGTDYEKFGISWGSNLLTLATSKGGGGTNRDMEINVGGSKWHFRTDGAVWVDAAGQTVGNARGVAAVDLQAWRSTATRVASGAYSVTLGNHNSATGECDVAIGTSCQASGQRSVALGNSATSSGYCSFAHGSTSSGSFSVAMGASAQATMTGQFAVGAKWSLSTATPQGGILQFTAQTTDATPTIAYPGNASNQNCTVPAKSATGFRALCLALSSEYKAVLWEITGLAVRDASNNTAFVGTPTKTKLYCSTGAESWDADLQVNDTTDQLYGYVTGEAGKNIAWTFEVFNAQLIRA